MHDAPTSAIQRYELRRWTNPQRTFFHALERLHVDYPAYNRPGILIITNSSYTRASAIAVINLMKELPTILEQCDEDTIVFWAEETDEAKRNNILVGLTSAPIFHDILA